MPAQNLPDTMLVEDTPRQNPSLEPGQAEALGPAAPAYPRDETVQGPVAVACPEGLSEPALQLLNIANEQYARGDLATCRVLLTAVLELAPANSPTLAALGSIHFQLGELPQARRRFEQAIELAPDNAILHVQLGAACLHLQDVPAFEAALHQALALDANCAEALQFLANLNLRLGQFAQAAKLYHRLLSLRPDEPAALLALAKCLYELGEEALCQAALERVLEVEPANQTARDNLAALRGRPRLSRFSRQGQILVLTPQESKP